MTLKDLSNMQIKDQKAEVVSKDNLIAYFALLHDWDINDKDGRITGVFKFENFAKGVVFINLIAKIAEEFNHHPDISIFEYRNVAVSFSTHEIGGLSQKDFVMAAKVQEVYDGS